MALYLNGTQIGQPKYNGNTLTAVYYNGVKVWPDYQVISLDASNIAGLWFDVGTASASGGAIHYNITNSSSSGSSIGALCIVFNTMYNFDTYKRIVINSNTGNLRAANNMPNTYYNAYLNATYPSGNIGECQTVATSYTSSNGNKTLTMNLNGTGQKYLYLRIIVNGWNTGYYSGAITDITLYPS